MFYRCCRKDYFAGLLCAVTDRDESVSEAKEKKNRLKEFNLLGDICS